MKIFIVDEISRASNYGIGTYIDEASELLLNLGHEVTIVKIFDGKDIVKKKGKNGVETVSIPSPRSNAKNELFYRNVVLILRTLISDDKEQCIFQLNYYASGSMIDSLRHYFKDCIITFSVHYFEWIFPLWGRVNFLKQIMRGINDKWNVDLRENVMKSFLFQKQMLQSVDYVICLCHYARKILEQLYLIDTSKIKVVYNGLSDGNKFLSESQKLALRIKYHFLPTEKLFIFAGRIDDLKGISFLINAYCKLKNEHQSCHLIIAGDGNFQKSMEDAGDLVREITFTGRISKAKLYDYYSIADIGILPSFSEQCSCVAIEMMMHGLPIIGTNSGGLDEMILEGETGFKLPVIEKEDHAELDVELLKERMLFFLQNDDLKKQMALSSRKRYELLYSEEKMAIELNKIYCQILL